MIQEKKYQIEAVEALVKKTIKLLEAPGDRKKTGVQGSYGLRQDGDG